MRLAAAIALALAAPAAADPVIGHVLTAPTAWLPRAGSAYGTAGLDHRGDGSIVVGYGLGGIASIELGADSDVRTCAMPPCDTDNLATPRLLPRAAFRMGARQDAWFAGQPAVALGVSVNPGDARANEAYVVASRAVAPVRLHAGAAVLNARDGGGAAMGMRVRPLGGLEWTPPQYPKTSLLVDIAWLPRFEMPKPALEWVLGWGVRYQALTWGSIELDVRHRQNEGLGGSTVMVRVNGVWER